jgi:AraC family transcriptional activator of tynA and feaB
MRVLRMSCRVPVDRRDRSMSCHDHAAPRHRAAHASAVGLAPYRFERITTADFAPNVRFEAWRAAAHRIVTLLPPREGAHHMVGTAQFVSGALGAFGSQEGSAYQTEVGRAPEPSEPFADAMVMTFVQQGTVVLESPSGRQQTVTAGSLAIYDATQPMRYHWSAAREAYLMLPRQVVTRALGSEPRGGSLSLNAQPLAPFLRSQLAMLASHGATLEAHDLTNVLDATVNLALLMLGSAGRGEEDRHAAGLYAASMSYLEAHAHACELDAMAVARGVGCSRATLYRVFAQHDTTVMACLRELRLQRVRDRLAEAPGSHIGALAYACGFRDQSVFGKLFRARFGLPASEWRAQCALRGMTPRLKGFEHVGGMENPT